MKLKAMAGSVLMLIAAQGWSVAIPSYLSFDPNADEGSATSVSSVGFFDEAADQYLSRWDFTKIKDPVFFFQLAPETLGTSGTRTSDPMELGFGAKWFNLFYGAGHTAFKSATAGNLADDKTSDQSTDIADVTDANGLKVGQTVEKSSEISYTEFQYQSLTLMGGLNIGALTLSVGDSILLDNGSSYGTFVDGDGTSAASTSETTTVNGKVTTSSIYAVDDTGFTKDSVFRNSFWTGVRLPLGFLDVLGSATWVIRTSDAGSQGGYRSAETQADGGYKAFGGFSNVVSFDSRDYATTSTRVANALPLSAGAEIPFILFQNNALFRGLVEYLAEFGSANLGQTYQYKRLQRSTEVITSGVNTGLVATTDYRTTETRDRSEYSEFNQQVSLPLQVTVTPNESVRFAVGYTPTLSTEFTSNTTRDKNVYTTTYSDGDTVAAASDADDETITQTIKYQTVKSSSEYLTLTHELRSALQIVLVKDVVRLNLGTRATATPINRYTSTNAYLGTGTSVTKLTKQGETVVSSSSVLTSGTDTKTTKDSAVNTVNVDTDLGLTFWLNPNVTFDFLAKTTRVLNLTATTDNGGLFNLNNFSVLMTIALPPPASAAK